MLLEQFWARNTTMKTVSMSPSGRHGVGEGVLAGKVEVVSGTWVVVSSIEALR